MLHNIIVKMPFLLLNTMKHEYYLHYYKLKKALIRDFLSTASLLIFS